MAKENFSAEIASFVDTLFSVEDKGYAYSPTKNQYGEWETHFFKWPQKRQELILHVLSNSMDFDVYLSPSLFKAPSAKQQAWKGTHYVWIEFDGNVPEELPKGIPEPSIRVQSSEQKHEHWYWRLKDFNTDGSSIAGLCKSLTYTLDADKSGWDYNQVLRPPGLCHAVGVRSGSRREHVCHDAHGPHVQGDQSRLCCRCGVGGSGCRRRNVLQAGQGRF